MKTIAPYLCFAFVLAWPATGAERTGEDIVKAKCSGCHATGLHGAPRIDDREAWTPRLKKGLDATVAGAIKGHGSMPARGGMADLTDAEFRSAVVYLLNPRFPAKPPAAPGALGPNQKVVDGVEISLGMKPVKEGVYHLTISLRDGKTHAAIEDARVEAAVTNPVMGTDSKPLQRETFSKATSYGGDFRVTGREAHVITVQVRRPGAARPIEARFDFKG